MTNAKGKIWIIFNSLTQQRSQPLSHQEMQLSLLTIKVRELDSLFIWTPGWENWQPLKAFLSSDQKFFTGVSANKDVDSIDINTVPNFQLKKSKKKKNLDEHTKTDIGFTKTDVDASSSEVHQTKTDIGYTKTDVDIQENGTHQKSKKPSKGPTHPKKVESKTENSTDAPEGLSLLKSFRNKVDKKAPEKSEEKDEKIDKKEFTQLVDPSYFDGSGRHESYYQPDVDGDEMLKDGVNIDPANAHFDFELRPHERTYSKRAERHAFKIEVILVHPTGKTLRSFSRNISLTGTLIEDNIPEEFQNKNLEILIHNQLETISKDAKLTLQGKVVGQITTRRLTFLNMSEKLLDKLEALLTSYISKQDALMKKKAG